MDKNKIQVRDNTEEDTNQQYLDYHTCPDPDAAYEEQFETIDTIDFDTIEVEDD